MVILVVVVVVVVVAFCHVNLYKIVFIIKLFLLDCKFNNGKYMLGKKGGTSSATTHSTP